MLLPSYWTIYELHGLLAMYSFGYGFLYSVYSFKVSKCGKSFVVGNASILTEILFSQSEFLMESAALGAESLSDVAPKALAGECESWSGLDMYN